VGSVSLLLPREADSPRDECEHHSDNGAHTALWPMGVDHSFSRGGYDLAARLTQPVLRGPRNELRRLVYTHDLRTS